MRTYVQALKFNGFRIPKTPLREFIFLLQWHSVEVAYHNFENLYNQRVHDWHEIMTELHTAWGYGYPQLCDIDGRPEVYFKSRKEALEVLEKMSSIYSSKTLAQIMHDFDVSSCSRWIKDVIAKSPADCKLVVIKSKLYTPNAMEIRNFESNVRMYKPCTVQYFGKAIWVAFNPNVPIDVDTLGMKRMSSDVEYLV